MERKIPGARQGAAGHFVSDEVVDGVEVWMAVLFVGVVIVVVLG